MWSNWLDYMDDAPASAAVVQGNSLEVRMGSNNYTASSIESRATFEEATVAAEMPE